MSFEEYRYLLLSDLYRIAGRTGGLALVSQMFRGDAFKYNFWLRTCRYAASRPLLRLFLYPVCRIMLRRLTFRLGVSIPWNTRIGSGFYIGHFGGIVINRDAIIGRNCNISQGVTIGQANRGRNKGAPTIGNNVYIGPGAMIVGAVNVGDNVAIGANSVVTRDVPDHAVVAGIPAEVISQRGSEGYVNQTGYDKVLQPGRTIRIPRRRPRLAR